jgi:hypothetical protein
MINSTCGRSIIVILQLGFPQTVGQWVNVCCTIFIQTQSSTESEQRFQWGFNQKKDSSPNAIHWWARKRCEEGSVTCEKPPNQSCLAQMPADTAWVLASNDHTQGSQHVSMSDRSAWCTSYSGPNFHPRKIWVSDRQMCLKCCHQFLQWWPLIETCHTTTWWAMSQLSRSWHCY